MGIGNRGGASRRDVLDHPLRPIAFSFALLVSADLSRALSGAQRARLARIRKNRELSLNSTVIRSVP
jgi:hypothetical protein